MKGKGKGERKTEPKEEKEKEITLQFPDLKPVDHVRMCPRYNAVLSRSEDEGVSLGEMDHLQAEMETLLASVAKRMRQLDEEIAVLSNLQEKVPTEPVPPPAAVTPKSGKKGGKVEPGQKRSAEKSKDEGKSSKKFKADTPGKKGEVAGKKEIAGKKGEPPGKKGETPAKKESPVKSSQSKTTQSKTTQSKTVQSKTKGKVQQLKSQEYEFPESPNKPAMEPLPKLPKNETPNRFWQMVEPYCADINHDDMRILEDILRSHEDDLEYHKIPNLGKHYSQKWAQEDLLEEQREGSKIGDKRRGSGSGVTTNASESGSLLKKMEESLCSSDPEESPFGPLTQRLVSALIEENIMTPLDDTSALEIEAAEAANMSPRSLAKQLNVGNTIHLERRIKRELEEQGILEPDERPDDNPDDEILAELRKRQQELKALSGHNLTVTRKLYKLAKEEMVRQDMRRKMEAADAEVLEQYRKIQGARQKKRALSKKEKDAALKALKVREDKVRQLESLG